MSNTLSPVLDLPFFELLNQPPVATTALSTITTQEDGTDRYIYYISTSAFYRYDIVADTWQQLATPVITPTTVLSMRYTKRRGFHGRVISATTNTITIPGIRGPKLDGKVIRLDSGKGAGQERTLTYTGEITHDFGVITGTTTSTLADSTKKWRNNQWAGYTVGITFGTNATQYKKVLYNDSTTLYFADSNLQPHDPWNNQIFVAATPYALPVTTAGSQAHYVIMSSSYSVSDWTVVPDSTTFFTTLTGGLYLISSAAAAPFFTFQYYDILNDQWQTKTTPVGIVPAALGTDVSIERTTKIGSAYISKTGNVSSTNRTITDSGLNLASDRYANHRITITGGTGMGQNRRITAHTSNTFTIARNWDINPDNTSTYEVWPDFDRLYLMGSGLSSMLAYSPENDYWMQGQAFDDGITTNISCSMNGWLPLGVSTGSRIAAGVTEINSSPTAGGSSYSIGDVLTLTSGGGTGAQVRVTTIGPGGVVTGLELIHSGTATGYATGTGYTTSGGTGTGCTVAVTGVGVTALITLATSHWFKTSEKVTFAGCSESAWNTEHTIIGVPSTTTFCVTTTATANMNATASQSTTVIVDPTKSWIPNEHVGRLVHVMVAGTSPTSQIRWITANTSNTLTVATITAAGNGTSKYVIYDSKVFGIDESRKETNRGNLGWATGGSTTTLIDNTKSWIPNQWANYFFKVEAGSGFGSGRIQIISNTETTLTYSAQGFTPDTTTKYEIADSWGLASAGSTTSITESTSKNWVVNQWAGKRVRITAGLGVNQEAAVSSNTATSLTTGTITAPDTTSSYAIIGIPPRGTGMDIIWAWGGTNSSKVGRYLYVPRGSGSNTLDIYDITTGKWAYGIHFHPQNEGFTNGSSYCYDGVDTIYMSRSATGAPIRILAFNVNTLELSGKMTSTFLQGTATIGNMMEITGSGSNQFVYILQNSGTLFARAYLF